MELKDYSAEELKAELKRRSDLVKAEKNKIKRCRMCKHWGAVTYTGKPVTPKNIDGYGFCGKTNEECCCSDKCHLTHGKP